MLVTFKSKAAPNVMMYEEHAKRMLDLLGKDIKRGIITKEETAHAIEKIQSEIALERSTHEEPVEEEDDADGQGRDAQRSVSFATRAYPLLEMLRAAQRSNNDVLWGV